MTALASPIFDSPTARQDIVFIEDNLVDWQVLAQAVAAKAKVVILDSQNDGLQQMAEYLAGLPQGSVDAIHLLSHGSTGQVQLGRATLTADNLHRYATELDTIHRSLSTEGDWLLYGCDVAAGEAGARLLDQLGRITQADMAASTNLTGYAARGGNWVLEARTGILNTAALAVDDYTGTLAVVSFTGDAGNTNAPNATVATGTPKSSVAITNTATSDTLDIAINGGTGIYQDTTSVFTGLGMSVPTGSSGMVVVTADNTDINSITLTVQGGKVFDFVSMLMMEAGGLSEGMTFTPNGNAANKVTHTFAGGQTQTVDLSANTNFDNLTSLTISSNDGAFQVNFDDIQLENIGGGNVAPVFSSGATGSVNENASTSTVVYTALAVDADSDTLSYALSGTDAGSFTINATTGIVRLTTAANYEVKSSYSINVLAKDATHTTTKAVTVNVNNINETPVYSSGNTGIVAENASTSTVIYTAAATDPEGGAVTYALAGTDAASFTINSSTGALTLNASANYETKTSYSLNVLAKDGVNTGLKSVTISVTNVNEKPTLTAPASQSVNQSVATALTGISVADPDSGSNAITVTLSAAAGTFAATTGSGVTVGGSGTGSVTLSGTQTNINSFIAASKVTYTTAAGATGSVTLNIGSDDGGNTGSGGTQTDSKTETLNIVVSNAAPTITTGASASVAENASTSTVVYTATATDAESDAITYSLTGTDAASFSIDASTGQMRLLTAADYETKSSYSITVNAKDANNTTTKAVTINVTDVNEAPSFTSSAAGTVAENAATSTVVYTATATDPESEAITYALSGTDASAFTINSSTGELTLNAAADYETKSSYSLEVIASDASSHTAANALTISVSNVNEPPVLTASASQNIAEATATPITGISISDPDADTNPITLALSAATGSFTGTSGAGVTVSGSGTNSITLTGSQTSLNAFISGNHISYTSVAGATGSITLNITSNDAGNSGSGGTQTDSKTKTLNVSSGPSTTVSSVAFSADTGVSSTDLITKTAAQTITGTLSAASITGETVEISLDNGTTWAVAANTIGQDSWSLGSQTLTASNTLQARVTNASGSSAPLTQNYFLDQTSPTTTIATQEFSSDTGASSTDFITSTDAQTISGTLSTVTAAG